MTEHNHDWRLERITWRHDGWLYLFDDKYPFEDKRSKVAVISPCSGPETWVIHWRCAVCGEEVDM